VVRRRDYYALMLLPALDAGEVDKTAAPGFGEAEGSLE
jgi:hypothetical protein